MRFYEAQAKPQGDLRFTPTSVSGSFAFTGEGQNWKKHEVLEIQDHKLVRTEKRSDGKLYLRPLHTAED
jgi:hypothetical protein